MNEKKVLIENGVLFFECPQCNFGIQVEINAMNCCIFRHGFFCERNADNQVVKLLEQINPHLNKEACDELVSSGRITGCGKPFKLERRNEDIIAVICDYI